MMGRSAGGAVRDLVYHLTSGCTIAKGLLYTRQASLVRVSKIPGVPQGGNRFDSLFINWAIVNHVEML